LLKRHTVIVDEIAAMPCCCCPGMRKTMGSGNPLEKCVSGVYVYIHTQVPVIWDLEVWAEFT